MPTESSTVNWLLRGDPAIRWQTLRDLAGAPAEQYAPERAEVATRGWGAELLARQHDDGQWRVARAEWPLAPTLYTLQLLRHCGLDPRSEQARRAVARVQAGVRWEFWGNAPFFDGEVEPCINGGVLAVGAYFGAASSKLVDRLLSEQLADGGWNCEAENGSVRSSFHTTICVLEGLLEYERSVQAAPAVTEARLRAEEYLLERRLLRRASTGEVIDTYWTRFPFPAYWRYDVLRALEHLRAAGRGRDPRLDEPLDIVRRRRRKDGRWSLGEPYSFDHHGIALDPGRGKPSRWVTLRAARVLERFGGG
ncbi:MAG: hypothetical protein KF875_13675 [Trueperaceae bacterium]|nr:hypothetical protein [Trueperaceae bacterium]MCC6309709.1 hypothetical protein [Trueperaceae bacterium]MCW5818959.1 hypothetical protein [Trueperaceae bacterium]